MQKRSRRCKYWNRKWHRANRGQALRTFSVVSVSRSVVCICRFSFCSWHSDSTISVPSSQLDPSFSARVVAVELDIALAMRECFRRHALFYPALIKLAEIWNIEQATETGADSPSILFFSTHLKRLLSAYPRGRSLLSFPSEDRSLPSLESNTNLLGVTPQKPSWWQQLPWTPLEGYFRCLELYLNTLVQTFNFNAMMELATQIVFAGAKQTGEQEIAVDVKR
jgi:hypothetical protein